MYHLVKITWIFLKKEQNSHAVLVFYTAVWKIWKKKVNKILDLSSSTEEAQIKGARHMEEVNEFIKFINEKIEEMEADRKDQEGYILELKIKAETLNEKVETMDRTLECQEKRKSILIYSVK